MKTDRRKEKSLDEFTKRLCDLVSSIVRHEIVRESNYLSRGVITLPQIHVLNYLFVQSHCNMRDITSGLGMKNSTLTGVMDRLVALGLARRFNSNEDRRVVIAAITPKGRKVMQGLEDDRSRTIKRIFWNISAKDRRAYIGILEKVAASVRAQYATGAGRNRGHKA